MDSIALTFLLPLHANLVKYLQKLHPDQGNRLNFDSKGLKGGVEEKIRQRIGDGIGRENLFSWGIVGGIVAVHENGYK